MYHHRLYGRIVSAPFALPAPEVPQAPPDIQITESQTLAIIAPSNREFSYTTIEDGGVHLCWSGLAAFEISADGRHVAARAADAASAESTYAYLLSQAISVALLHQGVEALHGVALEKDGSAIALVGDCGYGKSTIAAHAIARGARLLTDDLLVIENNTVLPGAARIKLAPDIAQQTLGARAGTPMNDERGKWIFPLEEQEFCAERLELSRIYALEPRQTETCVHRVSGGEALRALLAATFDPLELDRARLAKHLSFHAGLARRIPVFAARMQWGLENMDTALEALWNQS